MHHLIPETLALAFAGVLFIETPLVILFAILFVFIHAIRDEAMSAAARKRTAGGETADVRRPRGSVSTFGPPADCSSTCRTKPAAGMSRVDPRQDQRIDPPAREHRWWVSRQGTDAPECFRSAGDNQNQ
jgi:hypothetical protein